MKGWRITSFAALSIALLAFVGNTQHPAIAAVAAVYLVGENVTRWVAMTFRDNRDSRRQGKGTR